ncbi:hypothetical protein ES705_32509 [subsurface metagenome]
MTSKKTKAKKSNTPIRTDQVCVGSLCWNPVSEKLEFTFDSKNCPDIVKEKMKARTKMMIKENDYLD